MIRSHAPRSRCDLPLRAHRLARARLYAKRAQRAAHPHDVPPGCVLGELALDLADYEVAIGQRIELPDGAVIVIARPCARHIIAVPLAALAE